MDARNHNVQQGMLNLPASVSLINDLHHDQIISDTTRLKALNAVSNNNHWFYWVPRMVIALGLFMVLSSLQGYLNNPEYQHYSLIMAIFSFLILSTGMAAYFFQQDSWGRLLSLVFLIIITLFCVDFIGAAAPRNQLILDHYFLVSSMLVFPFVVCARSWSLWLFWVICFFLGTETLNQVDEFYLLLSLFFIVFYECLGWFFSSYINLKDWFRNVLILIFSYVFLECVFPYINQKDLHHEMYTALVVFYTSMVFMSFIYYRFLRSIGSVLILCLAMYVLLNAIILEHVLYDSPLSMSIYLFISSFLILVLISKKSDKFYGVFDHLKKDKFTFSIGDFINKNEIYLDKKEPALRHVLDKYSNYPSLFRSTSTIFVTSLSHMSLMAVIGWVENVFGGIDFSVSAIFHGFLTCIVSIVLHKRFKDDYEFKGYKLSSMGLIVFYLMFAGKMMILSGFVISSSLSLIESAAMLSVLTLIFWRFLYIPFERFISLSSILLLLLMGVGLLEQTSKVISLYTGFITLFGVLSLMIFKDLDKGKFREVFDSVMFGLVMCSIIYYQDYRWVLFVGCLIILGFLAHRVLKEMKISINIIGYLITFMMSLMVSSFTLVSIFLLAYSYHMRRKFLTYLSIPLMFFSVYLPLTNSSLFYDISFYTMVYGLMYVLIGMVALRQNFTLKVSDV